MPGVIATLPKFQFSNALGLPMAGGTLTSYLAGTTTLAATYQDEALTAANTNPIELDSRGECTLWLDSTKTYKFVLKNALGVVQWTVDSITNSTAFAQSARDELAAYKAELAASSGSSLVGYIPSGAGAVARTTQSKMRDIVSVSDFGIVSDGSTIQTSKLVAFLGTRSGIRGFVSIPYNTKFDVATVYAAVPVGVILEDESGINWGQPPSYKNKFRIMYSGDTVSDDTQDIIASPHHPAMMLLNMGTAGSVAAASRYGTILHGVGKNVDGDPLLGWLQQFAKDPGSNRWRISWRLQTPYSVAIANPSNWTANQVVAAGSYRLSDGGKVYTTIAGGVCGVAAPTGTGSGINDGGVLWNYVQSELNIDSTRFDIDENANAGFYSPSAIRMSFTGGGRQHYFEVDPATQDVVWRDQSRGLDIWKSSTAQGVRSGRIQSLSRADSTISASGALVLASPMHTLVASGGPWDITDLTLPAGQTSGTVTLWFLTGNLVLKNNVNIVTRTGADITSVPSMIVTLYKDASVSGAWVVLGKN